MLAAAALVLMLFAQATPASPVGTTLDSGGGLVTVDAVDHGDRFPPNCVTLGTPTCSAAMPGKRILVLWLKAKGDDSKLADALMLKLEAATAAADNGSKTKNFSGGMMEGRYFLAFAPPAADRNFTLHWGKNAPLVLGK